MNDFESDGGTGVWVGGFYGTYAGLADRPSMVNFDANAGRFSPSQTMDPVIAGRSEQTGFEIHSEDIEF